MFVLKISTSGTYLSFFYERNTITTTDLPNGTVSGGPALRWWAYKELFVFASISLEIAAKIPQVPGARAK